MQICASVVFPFANPQVGSCDFEITNNGSSLVNVTVLVQSRARMGQDPIAIKSDWGLPSVVPPQKQSLYVTVGKGKP